MTYDAYDRGYDAGFIAGQDEAKCALASERALSDALAEALRRYPLDAGAESALARYDAARKG